MPLPKDKKAFALLLSKLTEYEKLHGEQRDANNALNRSKTALGKDFAKFLIDEKLPPRTQIRVNNILYAWSIAEQEVLDPRKWHELWEKGELSDDQYFAALSVRKEDAKLSIGEDQCATITLTKPGKDADIRRKVDKDNPDATGTEIIAPTIENPQGIKPRLAPVTPTTVQPSASRKVRMPVRGQ